MERNMGLAYVVAENFDLIASRLLLFLARFFYIGVALMTLFLSIVFLILLLVQCE